MDELEHLRKKEADLLTAVAELFMLIIDVDLEPDERVQLAKEVTTTISYIISEEDDE